MSGKLGRDAVNIAIQGFAPTRVQTVTTALWTPGTDDRAFCVAADTDYQVAGAGAAASIKAGAIRVIPSGQTYKFTVGQNLEVM